MFISLANIFFLGAILSYFAPSIALTFPILALLIRFNFPEALVTLPEGVALLLVVSCILLSLTAVLSEKNKKASTSLGLIVAGASVGAICSTNFMDLFVYIEIVTISSALIIASGGNHKASLVYFITHIISGLIFLSGIVLLNKQTGNIGVRLLDADLVSSRLILLSAYINIAAFPFCFWLIYGYGNSELKAKLFLLASSTKISAFVILTCFVGAKILYLPALVTIFFGLISALTEKDKNKSILYLLISKLGFVLLAASSGNYSAIAGGALLASGLEIALLITLFNHSLTTGKRTDISTIAVFISCFCLINFPGSMGYIAKLLIHDGFKQSPDILPSVASITSSIFITLIAARYIKQYLKLEKVNYKFTSVDIPIFIFAIACIGSGIFIDPIMNVLGIEGVDYFQGIAVYSAIIIFSALAGFTLENKINFSGMNFIKLDFVFGKFPSVKYLEQIKENDTKKDFPFFKKLLAPSKIFSARYSLAGVVLWVMLLLGIFASAAMVK
jgi:formate hydrogenlyase subunit 3/multisubunit Na+/H+ antiporter MnhD subunit